jgi:hypothetical protein
MVRTGIRQPLFGLSLVPGSGLLLFLEATPTRHASARGWVTDSKRCGGQFLWQGTQNPLELDHEGLMSGLGACAAVGIAVGIRDRAAVPATDSVRSSSRRWGLPVDSEQRIKPRLRSGGVVRLYIPACG